MAIRFEVALTFALFVVCAGCTEQSVAPKGEPALESGSKNTPEDAYRNFMLANLSGKESAIRPLIVDNEEAQLLWQGAYPADVAAQLSKQYRSMEISRVESPRRFALHCYR